MHDYTAFTLQFLTQSKDNSIALPVNHLCCRQSWAVPTTGVSWTKVTENDPQKLNIPIFSIKEKVKVDRFVDLKRTQQKSHNAESCKNIQQTPYWLIRKHRMPHNDLSLLRVPQLLGHDHGLAAAWEQLSSPRHSTAVDWSHLLSRSAFDLSSVPPIALPLQPCNHRASSRLPGVLLRQRLSQALPPPLLPGDALPAPTA